MAKTTRRMLLGALIQGGVGMALGKPAREIRGAEARRRELYKLLGERGVYYSGKPGT